MGYVSSIVWYDYETFGTHPAWDRPAQFAGIRTDEDLNEIEPPVELFCRQADDYLPHPEAVLVTGITPQDCQRSGVPETEFIARINLLFCVPRPKPTAGRQYYQLISLATTGEYPPS